MLAKGAVRKVVPCKVVRSFFYWRLQRRLAEKRVREQLRNADDSLTDAEITTMLRRWTDQSGSFEGRILSLLSLFINSLGASTFSR